LKALTELEGKKRVLIVEDDMIISLVIENMVKELGHEVVGKATSGDEAIRLASDQSPDLVLMDIRLKGEMDGIEAVTEIKQKIDTSVIYLTGNSDRVNYERARETEFIDLITKPFTISDLTRSLELV
jgi:CheY-like chemotaxis protein